jgi:hypothetical protein
MHTVSNTSSEIHLCHTDCSLYDAGPLTSWLTSITSWLDANPNEVVTLLLVNSIDADAATLATNFEDSGITKYAYAPATVPATPAAWPTLQSLISANTRLITFVASLTGGNTAAAYLLDEFTSVWENPYDVTSASNFSCIPQRPTSVAGSYATAASSGKLFLMNHFLDVAQLFDIETPNVDASSTTNSPDVTVAGGLANAAQTCKTASGSAPNFLLVDWFNVGPAISSADALNGVTGSITGRTTVSSAILSQTFQGAAGDVKRGRSAAALVLGFAIATLAGWI